MVAVYALTVETVLAHLHANCTNRQYVLTRHIYIFVLAQPVQMVAVCTS